MTVNIPQKNTLIGWQEVKLSQIAHINMGQSPLSSAYNETGNGLPLIQGNNDIKNKKTISNIWTTEITKTTEKGSVILTVRAPVGAIGIAHDRICIGRGVCAIESEYKPFIWYFLSYFETKWNTLEQGSTFTAVNSSDIKKLKLHLPPLPEQNRIVAVLETWDRALELLGQKIEVKKQIKKGLMQGLLTGKRRLSGFKDKWETVELGEVSEFINGYTFKSSTYSDDGVYKIITIANVQDGLMFIDEPKLVDELPNNIIKDQILKKGDILISMTGNVGRVCTVNTDNCLLNQRVGKIRPTGISKDLLYCYLHDRRFLNQMIDSAQGGAQGNLSTGDIKRYSFDIPKSEEEKNAIAKILTTADQEITELENKRSTLKEQKRYLLNNLITGTIRTPVDLVAQFLK